MPEARPAARLYVACPEVDVNTVWGVPSTTARKRNAPPLLSWAESPVPVKRAMKPVPDQENRGRAAVEMSTRPNQRTPAATTPPPPTPPLPAPPLPALPLPAPPPPRPAPPPPAEAP